ncbi:MAG: hypothetical protein FWG41_05535 [Methanomassiliicoccaceae archaeon]|nr:hypothetical protein [Methanomassiliicoccaceae archaeon]
MGFTDKVMKGFDDITKSVSDDVDKWKLDGKIEDCRREMDEIKKEMGNLIFTSYLNEEPVEEKFIAQCEKLEALVKQINEYDAQKKSGTHPPENNS